jgi:ribulose-5-phosphate 4-epimerase/fuculose-1-phosphate aldolase
MKLGLTKNNHSMGVHFALLTAADMIHVDSEAKVIGGNSEAAVNAAGFMIHAAIHEARPDVTAAAHTHSKHAKAWSTFGLPLDNINQDTCMFYNIQAVYKNFGGVVLQKEEGRNIANALGATGKVALLQNHGLLTCGETVDECAHLFNTVERACEVQLMVEAAGLEKTFIPDEEAHYTNSVLGDPVS